MHHLKDVGKPYLHGQCSCLLVVVVQKIGHEGGVVRQVLAHSQSDGLTAELTVAFYRVYVDGKSRADQEEQQVKDDGETANGNVSSADNGFGFWMPVFGAFFSDKCLHFNVPHVFSVLGRHHLHT